MLVSRLTVCVKVFKFVMAYSNSEYTDMVLAYGESGQNGRAARRLYEERFPDRRLPSHTIFHRLVGRLRDTGTLSAKRPNAGAPRRVRTPSFEEDILHRFENNPGTSTRSEAHDVGVSHRTVWQVVHEQQLYPYRAQKVQAMGPADHPLRTNFSQWYIGQVEANPEFCILFTDEAHFTQDGIFNTHNTHAWSDQNPHTSFVTARQDRFSVNVWAGIVDNHLVGPFFLPRRLDGRAYLAFLQNDLPGLLEEIPLNVRLGMFFQHDGAPPHFSLAVRQYLTGVFGIRWVGRGGPVAWPPRSPDLTCIDFFLWGFVKSLVYETPVPNHETLVERINEAFVRIRALPGMMERIKQNMLRRCQLCVEQGGRHFEPLL